MLRLLCGTVPRKQESKGKQLYSIFRKILIFIKSFPAVQRAPPGGQEISNTQREIWKPYGQMSLTKEEGGTALTCVLVASPIMTQLLPLIISPLT